MLDIYLRGLFRQERSLNGFTFTLQKRLVVISSIVLKTKIGLTGSIKVPCSFF